MRNFINAYLFPDNRPKVIRTDEAYKLFACWFTHCCKLEALEGKDTLEMIPPPQCPMRAKDPSRARRRVRIRRHSPYTPILPFYPKHAIGGVTPLDLWLCIYCSKHNIQRQAMALHYPNIKPKWVGIDLAKDE